MGPTKIQTDALSIGSVEVQPKFAKVDLAASGDLIAAVTGKRIRVIAGCLVAAGAVTAKFQSGASTDLTGAMSLITGTPLNLDASAWGQLQTVSGEKLNLVLGSGVQVSGWLVYIEVG